MPSPITIRRRVRAGRLAPANAGNRGIAASADRGPPDRGLAPVGMPCGPATASSASRTTRSTIARASAAGRARAASASRARVSSRVWTSAGFPAVWARHQRATASHSAVATRPSASW
jgi:hypothetical protein